MKFAIIVSKKDPAGLNIAKHLEKQGIPVHREEKDIIYLENIDKNSELRNYDFIIFASRHKGAKSKLLSLHAPGNWKQADFGGKPGEVCPTSAIFLKHMFKILNKNKENYPTSLEVTHHGPYIEKTCCFIEIGSNEEDWKDEKAAEIIAETIKQAITSKPDKAKIAIGLGGPHYCPNFNKIQLNSDYAIGHIIPEYSLPVSEELIKQALNKTIPKPEIVLSDWKGLGKSEEKQKLLEILKKLNIKLMRTSEIEKE